MSRRMRENRCRFMCILLSNYITWQETQGKNDNHVMMTTKSQRKARLESVVCDTKRMDSEEKLTPTEMRVSLYHLLFRDNYSSSSSAPHPLS